MVCGPLKSQFHWGNGTQRAHSKCHVFDYEKSRSLIHSLHTQHNSSIQFKHFLGLYYVLGTVLKASRGLNSTIYERQPWTSWTTGSDRHTKVCLTGTHIWLSNPHPSLLLLLPEPQFQSANGRTHFSATPAARSGHVTQSSHTQLSRLRLPQDDGRHLVATSLDP